MITSAFLRQCFYGKVIIGQDSRSCPFLPTFVHHRNAKLTYFAWDIIGCYIIVKVLERCTHLIIDML